jgi:spermidine synthase
LARLAAGFLTIPAIGIAGTTALGILASSLAIGGVVVVARRGHEPAPSAASPVRSDRARPSGRNIAKREKKPASSHAAPRAAEQPWLAVLVLGISGFSTLMYEIAWIRVLSLVTGPTTYAFAAALAAVIGGVACGSTFGAWIAGRSGRPALWLACALAGSALATSWTTSFVGTDVPRMIAEFAVRSSVAGPSSPAVVMLVATLMLPTAAGLGIAFPLALEIAGGRGEYVAQRVGMVYFANTLAAVAGALVAGFVAIPAWGLQRTLELVGVLLIVGAVSVAVRGYLPRHLRVASLVPAAVAAALLMWSPPWDRELLASGVYKYAAAVPRDVDLESALKAGTLLYYREGAASTVSVRELAGARSMAIDGKVDASTAGDMLTQKALAHLPLLLHPNPRDLLIIGLGSGVTLASALVHPIRRADVVEISPEVVEASTYFAAENRDPLEDPRSRLVLGDGRSHLQLSSRQYDVIISEPSNPWMAGVAALFTREFFTAARNRLAPGGIICQWAHTYNITGADLRSIVATFRSVFPHGTMWLIGRSDLLLVASVEPLEGRFANLRRGWETPEIAADLSAVSAVEPFAFLSLFAGGAHEMERYASGAPLQVDDRMALEFSGPLAANLDAATENARSIFALGGHRNAPPEVRDALATARAAEWRNRGTMMFKAEDYVAAYEDHSRALALDPADEKALDGLVRSAVVVRRESEALQQLRASMRAHPDQAVIRVATSKLLAATGAFEEAISVVRESIVRQPDQAAALEQLAAIFGDIGDAARLREVVARLEELQPDAARTAYYEAVYRVLEGDLDGALVRAREAAARDPGHAAAHNLIGVIYANLDRQESAGAAFHTARRLDPRDSTAYVNLGLLQQASGHRPAAARYFTEALLLDPRSRAAREGLAQVRVDEAN